MSKQQKKVVSTQNDLKPTTAKISTTPTPERVARPKVDMLFGRENYLWMGAGFGVMCLGYIVMTGGKMPSPDVWEPNRIYGFTRTVLAPFLILFGLGMQVKAIFAKKRSV